jgi:uncharacterized membrane protein SpoIIM required for sporulation
MANNMTSAFLGMILGILLAIFPIMFIITNGYLLGYVASKSVEAESIFILWRLLPHGIFEVPAILISLALGIRLGFLLMYNCITHHKKSTKNPTIFLLMLFSIIFLPISLLIYIYLTITNNKLRKKFYLLTIQSFRIFFLIVIPLLVIAGIIEGILIGVVG